MLAEMFPEASSLEIRNCLMVSSGDVESAVQLMLLKKDNVDDDGKENCHRVQDLSPEVRVGLHRCTVCKSSELNFFLKKNFPLNGQTRQGKSFSRPINLARIMPLVKPLTRSPCSLHIP